ncbi:MAG: [Fe-S]-binding protein [Planctomycetes bacterium RBG_16_64_10]|nr:MAG: [Fe-S]-binding protein [Planctomycetes bacterium RBG_16_64_10]
MTSYPAVFRVRQRFLRVRVDDVAAEVHHQLAALALDQRIHPGQTVAITVGSRGIANIDRIVQAAVAFLHRLGASPFLVPAMGSHGAATAEGQRKIIEGYGITESYCGCPIRSSMETVVVGRADEGFPIHVDGHALRADHVLLCNRIKPHTQFDGSIQSGLVKMLLVGLGKHAGAKTYHAAFQDHGFDRIVRGVGRRLFNECHVVGGLAIVENAYDETARIVGVRPERIFEREAELLQLAEQWMARLPFAKVDILVLDEIGKNISGAGMDTNVVGRKQHADLPASDRLVQVKRIVARSLTAESHGNATGIGLADFCTRRLAQQVDRHSTWINGVTAGHLDAVKLPPEFATDREILAAALTTIGLTAPHEARLLWVRNTLVLDEVECSAAYLAEACARDDLEVLTGARALPFDAAGDLPPSMARLT